MIFLNGTEALLRKLNNMQVPWEIPEANVRFEASFLDVVIGFFESLTQLNRDGLCVLKDFLEYVNKDINYIYQCDGVDETETTGWIYKCFEDRGFPIIQPVIDHRMDIDEHGRPIVIFTIEFNDYKGARSMCPDCLCCSKDFGTICDR